MEHSFAFLTEVERVYRVSYPKGIGADTERKSEQGLRHPPFRERQFDDSGMDFIPQVRTYRLLLSKEFV